MMIARGIAKDVFMNEFWTPGIYNVRAVPNGVGFLVPDKPLRGLIKRDLRKWGVRVR